MKVTVKEWNAVASWRWDMPDDEVCGICRVQFDGTCPTCKFPGDDCPLCMFGLRFLRKMNSRFDNRSFLVIGNCGHSFHMVRLTSAVEDMNLNSNSELFLQHCLNKWINQETSKQLCPMCRQSTKSPRPLVCRLLRYPARIHVGRCGIR